MTFLPAAMACSWSRIFSPDIFVAAIRRSIREGLLCWCVSVSAGVQLSGLGRRRIPLQREHPGKADSSGLTGVHPTHPSRCVSRRLGHGATIRAAISSTLLDRLYRRAGIAERYHQRAIQVKKPRIDHQRPSQFSRPGNWTGRSSDVAGTGKANRTGWMMPDPAGFTSEDKNNRQRQG